jgi:uncharacterized protein YecT (DUF1311 family)
MSKLIYLFLILVIPFQAFAGSGEMRKKQKECGDLSDHRQIAGCYSTLYGESDALLSKEYAELAAYLHGADLERLKEAQRKWIHYKDADCLFADPRKESDVIAGANQASCRAIRTIERLEQLEWYNKPWNKGCNGCPW